MLHYAVVYEKGQRNWGAYVPDLPGCVSTGDIRQEIERNIKEAIDFHMEGLIEDGLPVPEPISEVGFVDVASATPTLPKARNSTDNPVDVPYGSS